MDSPSTDIQPAESNAGQPQKKPKKKPLRVLLLTNRDSDNLGDQIIEATDIALITTAMRNLGYQDEQFFVKSKAGGIVPKKYILGRDPSLLKKPEWHINRADLIIFGGAPVFNYRYQLFYERTALTLEIAEKFGTPVLFSAIGVDSYDEDNEKCQRLKQTLNLDCVRSITTRDNFEALQKFVARDSLKVAKVSDPAVFTSDVFRNFVCQEKPETPKVGIFVMRANGFTDNGVNFTREQAAHLWLDLAAELEERGYDYEFITSGHFGDEAFMDSMIREFNVSPSKCVFNMNTPEQLVEKISSYSAIVTCRLHPSIIAYSLNVPALGIVWNSKVSYFYEAIGYPERIVTTEGISGEKLVDLIQGIMGEDLQKDPAYLASVYNSLFQGIKGILKPDSSAEPYPYEELVQKLPAYPGTTPEELAKKVQRKMRRTYGKYNELAAKEREARSKMSSDRAKRGARKAVSAGLRKIKKLVN